jgi:hypothetical protein
MNQEEKFELKWLQSHTAWLGATGRRLHQLSPSVAYTRSGSTSLSTSAGLKDLGIVLSFYAIKLVRISDSTLSPRHYGA